MVELHTSQRRPQTHAINPHIYVCVRPAVRPAFLYSFLLCFNTVTIEALPEPTDGSSSPLTWILVVLIVVLIVAVVIFTVVVVV